MNAILTGGLRRAGVKSDKETGHICDNWCSHNCKTCLIKGKTCARHRWGDDTPVRGSLDECSGVVSRKGEFVPCSQKVAGKGVSDVTGVVLYMCDRHLDAVRYAVFERGWKWHIEELEGE